jgi:hypothetical protein
MTTDPLADPVLRAIDWFPFEHYERPGIYRRRIRTAISPGFAQADMEDDPHRHGVRIEHDGERVLTVRGSASRTPWSSCRGAVHVLHRLAGMPLSPDPQAVYRHTDGRAQCTHLIDLAGLAVSHAARGIAERQYDAQVPCMDTRAPREVRLWVDGEERLAWTLQRTIILAPRFFAGQDLRTMMPWAKQCIVDRDTLEAVIVLRRAVFTSGNRMYDLDRTPTAAATGHVNGACHVFQQGVAERALRREGSTLDFSGSAEALLRDLDAAAMDTTRGEPAWTSSSAP